MAKGNTVREQSATTAIAQKIEHIAQMAESNSSGVEGKTDAINEESQMSQGTNNALIVHKA